MSKTGEVEYVRNVKLNKQDGEWIKEKTIVLNITGKTRKVIEEAITNWSDATSELFGGD